MSRLVNRLTLGQAPFRIFSIIQEDRERFRRAYERLMLSVTLLGYPALAGCIVVATPLFRVLYSPKWDAAILPFQILCFGGMLKLLNNYGSQANEAAGAIWNQAARQGVGTVLVVVGAAAGSHFGGIVGASIGVTAAMVVLTLSMQELVRRAIGFSWPRLLAPQVPALVCTGIVVAALSITLRVLARVAPDAHAWQQLAILGVVGLLTYFGFVLFAPFNTVRVLVSETVDELFPAPARRVMGRLGVGSASQVTGGPSTSTD
jgi:O-antigen/teichoic acid export membrane protein